MMNSLTTFLSNLTWSKTLRWLDDNILLLLAGFLLAFIPLYPKLPLFEAIPGYIVRVRFEDILVLLTIIVWFIQVLRGKARWRTGLSWVIGAYILVGVLSLLSAVFLIHTVPFQTLHVGKSALHLFRYIEYFSLFFVMFSAIKQRKDAYLLMGVLALTVLGISIYGYGQKFWYWPVYSTMNREFSKGVRLYLTEHARVQSTFGGHYDLGGYLVIALPMLFAILQNLKNRWLKLATRICFWLGVWLLVMSAARSSFAAFLVGLSVVIILYGLQQKTWLKRAWWSISHGFVYMTITLMILLFLGDDMFERFIQVLQGYPALYSQYQELEIKSQEVQKQLLVTIGVIKLPKATPPPDGVATTGEVEILVPSDERPVTTKPTTPSDVYVNVPEYVVVATESATGEITYTTEERDRTYSECAQKRGLSLCIRLDTLWPLAIQGFRRNPLVGSGYATLNKDNVGQFTEAESTDNNFLRTLGETGLLGVITFYGAVILAMKIAATSLFKHDRFVTAISIGYIGAAIGLLINATYIDVFASSKVAFTFWALTGLMVAVTLLPKSEAAVVAATTAQKTALPTTVTRPRRRSSKRA